MKKKMMLLATINVILFVGCNQSKFIDQGYEKEDRKYVYWGDGMLFGVTNGIQKYDNGSMLFDQYGRKIGFIDKENFIYYGVNEKICGGDIPVSFAKVISSENEKVTLKTGDGLKFGFWLPHLIEEASSSGIAPIYKEHSHELCSNHLIKIKEGD